MNTRPPFHDPHAQRTRGAGGDWRGTSHWLATGTSPGSSPYGSPSGSSPVVPPHHHSHRPQVCRNCNSVGHLYRSCPHPVTSFGLVCFKKLPDGSLRYLLIQRRDSLCKMEFARGKYNLHDADYIRRLITGMTRSEQQQLLSMPFEDVWNDVWAQAYMPHATTEFLESARKFDRLRRSGLMQRLVTDHPSEHEEPEYGLPKGRRKLREADLDCAVREFCEETGFVPTDLEVLPSFQPLEEVFYGTNGVLYRHVYYVARVVANQDRVLTVDPNNTLQAREVKCVAWFAIDEAIARIRPHNVERKALLADVHHRIAAMA